MLANFDRINRLTPTTKKDIQLLDWALIRFASKNKSFTERTVLKKFNGDKTYLQRLKRLHATGLISEACETCHYPDGSLYDKPTGVYSLSSTGDEFLKDYKADRREDIKNRIFIPIAVTILTNIAIAALKWLLPYLQQWLASSP